MKLIIFTLFVFASFQLCAQSNLKPFIKAAGAWSSYDMLTIDAGLAAGVHFNEHLSLQMGVNNVKLANGQLDIVTLSMSPTYRIFKSKYPVSPVIGIDVGTQIWSNGNGRYLTSSYNFIDFDPSYSNYRYNRGLFFGKVKLLADFKINMLNLMFGPTFNLMYFKIEEVKKDWFTGTDYKVVDEYADEFRGFGLELSLMYTFPMKKRVTKAASGGE